ncbi:uncharacterized protein LOC131239489 [Magnolia sinica]|uniref:uncharacterized protein LOC131239489 n=1 Tax=Magnolia sinica TaxID=86752 RepID=UPI00265A31F4|nr:uncharacterized protein LOC131239489 [Magnolia sinica]
MDGVDNPIHHSMPAHKTARSWLETGGDRTQSASSNQSPPKKKWIEYIFVISDSAYRNLIISKRQELSVKPQLQMNSRAKLLKADLAFLECLEKSWTSNTKGDARIAYLYRSMCIAGLRNILIPYRMHLVRLQSGPSMVERLGNLNGKNNTCRAETNLNNRS